MLAGADALIGPPGGQWSPAKGSPERGAVTARAVTERLNCKIFDNLSVICFANATSPFRGGKPLRRGRADEGIGPYKFFFGNRGRTIVLLRFFEKSTLLFYGGVVYSVQ